MPLGLAGSISLSDYNINVLEVPADTTLSLGNNSIRAYTDTTSDDIAGSTISMSNGRPVSAGRLVLTNTSTWPLTDATHTVIASTSTLKICALISAGGGSAGAVTYLKPIIGVGAYQYQALGSGGTSGVPFTLDGFYNIGGILGLFGPTPGFPPGFYDITNFLHSTSPYIGITTISVVPGRSYEVVIGKPGYTDYYPGSGSVPGIAYNANDTYIRDKVTGEILINVKGGITATSLYSTPPDPVYSVVIRGTDATTLLGGEYKATLKGTVGGYRYTFIRTDGSLYTSNPAPSPDPFPDLLSISSKGGASISGYGGGGASEYAPWIGYTGGGVETTMYYYLDPASIGQHGVAMIEFI